MYFSCFFKDKEEWKAHPASLRTGWQAVWCQGRRRLTPSEGWAGGAERTGSEQHPPHIWISLFLHWNTQTHTVGAKIGLQAEVCGAVKSRQTAEPLTPFWRWKAPKSNRPEKKEMSECSKMQVKLMLMFHVPGHTLQWMTCVHSDGAVNRWTWRAKFGLPELIWSQNHKKIPEIYKWSECVNRPFMVSQQRQASVIPEISPDNGENKQQHL